MMDFSCKVYRGIYYLETVSEDGIADFGESMPRGTAIGEECDGILKEVYTGDSATCSGNVFGSMNDDYHVIDFSLPIRSSSYSIDGGHGSTHTETRATVNRVLISDRVKRGSTPTEYLHVSKSSDTSRSYPLCH